MEHLEAFNTQMVAQADLPNIGSKVTVEGWHQRGWVHRLALSLRAEHPHLDFDVRNHGQGGATSRDVASRVEADRAVNGIDYDLVFLGCGINDIWRRFQNRRHEAVDLQEYTRHLDTMLAQLTGYCRQVVVISETPFGPTEDSGTVAAMNAELIRYNTAAQQIAAAHDVLFLDAWTPFTAVARQLPINDETSGLWSDDVHLTELGDTVVLQQVESLLREHRVLDNLIDHPPLKRPTLDRSSPVVRPALLAPRLRPGDRVRLVSPASFPSQEWIAESIRILQSWDLQVEVGDHALDQRGYMAGRDEDRLADLNDAFRDPGVRAIFATRGGAGAYRIADRIDFDAVRADPKPIVGFSDITNLHLVLWHRCRVAGIHGGLGGALAPQAIRGLLMDGEPITLHRNPEELTAAISFPGQATGHLIGGNLRTIAGCVGAGLPSLDGAILLLEDERTIGLGQVDRQLTQLLRSHSLDGLRAVALGMFTGFDDFSDRGWTLLDVLHDRLAQLGVPVLGGLPLGHGPDPIAVPVGTIAHLDAATGTLTVESVVE